MPAAPQRLPLLAGSALLVGAFPIFSGFALRTSEASHGGMPRRAPRSVMP